MRTCPRATHACFSPQSTPSSKSTAGSLARDGEAVPALKVEYVPQKLPFKKLLGVFWREHDPTATAEEGQFGETKDGRVPGPAVIWASDVAEQSAAERGRTLLQQSGLFRTGKEQFGDLVKPIATEVRRLDGWQWAEAPDELQGWYLSNEGAYKKLRLRRDKFLQDHVQAVQDDRVPPGGRVGQRRPEGCYLRLCDLPLLRRQRLPRRHAGRLLIQYEMAPLLRTRRAMTAVIA